MGAVRFGPPQTLTLWLRDRFGAMTFVETGTYRGATARWAGKHFARVITIEGQDDLHEAAMAAGAGRRNMTFLKGDSRTLLSEVVQGLTGPAVFWLDAHWCMPGTFGKQAECPVLEELRAVDSSPHEHLILVDDARLFFLPPGPPHSPDDWPGLVDLIPMLSTANHPRYIAVFEDALVAIPIAARRELVTFLHACKGSLLSRLRRRLRMW